MSAENEKSLADLSLQEARLKRRLETTPGDTKARAELDQVQAEIQEWGTSKEEGKTYRIM